MKDKQDFLTEQTSLNTNCLSVSLSKSLWDTPSELVMQLTQWDSIYDLYKLSLVKLFYNIVSDNMPTTISDLAVWHNSPFDLRGYKKAVVPRFFTYFMKIYFRYRGAVLWNFVSDYFRDSCSFKQFHRKVQSDPHLRNSDLLVHKNYKGTFCIVILLPLSLVIHSMYFMHFFL